MRATSCAAPDGVRLADRLARAGGDAEDLVADRVAQRVVDPLEVVEVDEQDAEVRAALLGQRERLRHLLPQQVAVRQSRERVEVGEAPHLRLDARLAPERDGELPHLVRVERLLEENSLSAGGIRAESSAGSTSE